ncbi:MAG: hypothetical protein WBF49_10300 [Methyloceanibacter sp.]|jgi:hypothetical protein
MAAEQFEPMPPKASSCYQRHMRINWREVCKFLSGAFFVNAGILFYFYLIDTPVPILGTDFVISPEVNGLRSIAHFAFFLITFCLGFIRK